MKGDTMMEEDNHTLEASGIALQADLMSPGSRSGGLVGLQIPPGHSKYAQLLSVLEEIGKDIRPTYAGSKSSAEKLKRGIVHARILVRECLIETERSAHQ